MLKIFGNKAVTNEVARNPVDETESLRLDEQTVQRLHDALEAIDLKLTRSKAEAARCLANPGSVSAQELQNALVAEREDGVTHDEAARAYQDAAEQLARRQTEIATRRAEEDRAARKQAYEEARTAYFTACQALIAPALEVRRLAAAAGVWLPNWVAGDLLFASDSDVAIGGQPLPVWSHG
ncbi:hypothetical protein [Burkholderia seminalis]|uniref:Uncharacterized protein n=2 Tax=Burkholderia cepacia complex TaxID=87882 RepID=A0A8A8D5A1_9BURK|nr:hypothetical protein [Burkholderia seminalis]QTO19908.1 hypothetical protein DT99_006645 [Burkholderia seminalis]